jgi:hypothetical protein
MGFSPSIKCVVKIPSMRLAAALLVPWLGALPDEFDPFIPLLLRFRAGQTLRFNPREVIPPAHDGVHPAHRAEKIGVGMLIPHDAAGDGGNPFFIKKWSVTLYALHQLTSKLIKLKK